MKSNPSLITMGFYKTQIDKHKWRNLQWINSSQNICHKFNEIKCNEKCCDKIYPF
jgi:hypothetical protein